MKKVYIWGCGKNARKAFDAIDRAKYEIIGMLDTDPMKQAELWDGKLSVSAPSVLRTAYFDVVVISLKQYYSIVRECEQLGISKSRIAPYFDEKCEHDVFEVAKLKISRLERQLHKYELMLRNVPYELSELKSDIPVLESSFELARMIIENKRSLCRFGDGEFEIIRNKKRPWFQDPNEKLGQRLLQVLQSDTENIIIAIPDNFGKLEHYNEDAAMAIREYMDIATRREISEMLCVGRVYYDAYISRPYILYKDSHNADNLFPLLKQIWKDRDVLIVEGEYSRMGVNNDLLEGAKSIKRILCPQKNAYDCYPQILDTVVNRYAKGDLVLISLGPTATVLAYDLACEGMQAIDIGQIDNEYEWYLRKVSARVPIEGKCVAELQGHRVLQYGQGQEYCNQIVANLSR